MRNGNRQPALLVIDDDEDVRGFVEEAVSRNGYAFVGAAEGGSGVQAALDCKPELIILDLGLPGESGLRVCRKLRTWYRNPILVLSGDGEEATIVRALDCGADDYLTKPFRVRELLARIRALLRRSGEGEAVQAEIAVGDLNIDLARRLVHCGSATIRLTRTEFDVLAFLVRNADRVVSSEKILREVWGQHHGDYAQSLRVHIGHIRKKIEADPANPSRLLTEPGVGYRFAAPQVERQSARAAG